MIRIGRFFLFVGRLFGQIILSGGDFCNSLLVQGIFEEKLGAF